MQPSSNNPVIEVERGVTREPVSFGTPRILVVDDSEGNRYVVSHLLRSAGMNVIEGTTGEEALRHAATLPDLIVLDINLPDISGHEVLKRIRQNPEISWVPIMHVTASFTQSEDHARGLDLGADAYQIHPIDPPVFLATVRALLRLNRAERKVRRASQEWRAAFDSLDDSMFIIGSSSHSEGRDRIQRCNRSAARLVGREPRDVIGMPWTAVLKALGARRESGLSSAVPSNPGESIHADVELRGRWYTLSMQAAPRVTGDAPFSVCVLRNITERKNAEREREELMERAQAARLEAEAASRAKGEFLAVMSHELRTPLNAIGGYVDLIAMGIRGPLTEEQSGDLARIKRSQATLTTLINDVLNFAKAESGELEFHIASFSLVEALDRASEVVEHQLEHRGLKFIRHDSNPELAVLADADKVHQILLNLLSNAIKFTPIGGTITLASRENGGLVSVTVSDTGSGIPATMQEAIFEPFIQVQTSKTREHSGVGLGLAISRNLARAMGGELAITSSTPEGTTFELSLPSQ